MTKRTGMVKYETVIRKFSSMGEKTGWTYIEITAEQAELLNPGVRTSYRVKGKLDTYAIKQVAILPMGNGEFIMPLNASMRKALGKRAGNKLSVALQLDASAFAFSEEFINCLADEPKALAFFETLTGSHQKYFSKWIDSAKTDDTKAKRIARAVNALARHMGYAEMIREKPER